MSYGHNGRTILVAQAMNGGDYMLAPGARLYIGPHGRPEESLGGVLDQIGSGLKGAAKGGLAFFKEGLRNEGALDYATKTAPASRSSMPSWLLPVGLAAGAGVLALVLLKKRGR